MADEQISYEEIVMESEEKMSKAVDHLKHEFKGLRTGRASTSLVEHLTAEYYGAPTPLSQLANLSAPEANLIVIKPFDTSCIKDIEKAIIAANLGLNPQNDGRIVRLAIPPLSGERRQQLGTQVKQLGEQTKVNVRNIRRDGNKALEQAEKAKSMTEDSRDTGKEEMDKITKSYTDKVDELVKTKTAEIMEV